MKAIRKYGIFYGTLMASDRLQRCHQSSKKYYPIDPETGLAIDYPVEYYFLNSISKKPKIGK